MLAPYILLSNEKTVRISSISHGLLVAAKKYPGRGSNPQPSASEADWLIHQSNEKQGILKPCADCYREVYCDDEQSFHPCEACLTRWAAQLRSILTPQQLRLLIAELVCPSDAET
jgi:hypothetical protein